MVVQLVLQTRWQPWAGEVQWPAIRIWQLIEGITEADPFTLNENLPKISVSTILWWLGIWSKSERWKKLIKWVPHELTEKKCCFEVLSYFMQQWTISLWIVTCNKKWNLYDNWQWPAQWSNPEGTPKPNLLQKKVMVTVWSSAAHLIHYSFLNPMTSLQRSIISKSMRCNKNCNACSKQWSTERTQFFSTTTLYHTSHN